jgi:hypothetical protein
VQRLSGISEQLANHHILNFTHKLASPDDREELKDIEYSPSLPFLQSQLQEAIL